MNWQLRNISKENKFEHIVLAKPWVKDNCGYFYFSANRSRQFFRG